MRYIKLFFLTGLVSLGTSVFADNSALNVASTTQGNSTTTTHNSIGFGLAYNQNIYEGVGNVVHVLPLLNLTYDDFFLKGFTAGYTAYEDASTSFAFVLQPLFGGYDSSDSSELEGMSNTSYLVNAGGQMQYRLMPFVATLDLLHDLSGRTDGNSADIRLAAMVPFDDERFGLIPSITAQWLSSDITDYYYGVSSGEATSSRPAYNPGSAWNMQYGLTFKYQISEHFGTTLGYTLTQYPHTISDSPIVSRSTSSSVLGGISYIF